jgi:hypothetical protein
MTAKLTKLKGTTMMSASARSLVFTMSPLACLFSLLLLSSSVGAEAIKDDPGSWFRDGYAPLWAKKPGAQLDAMLSYYAPNIVSHRTSGETTTDASAEWLGPSVEAWLAEGWLRSELVRLEVDRLNESTVVFKARWADFYANDPMDHSCGWYLADFLDGAWRFSSYADLDCSALDS